MLLAGLRARTRRYSVEISVKIPRYTAEDLRRYKNGYRKAANTDVAATFRRVRAEMQKNVEEVKIKVQPLKRAAK